MAVPRRRHSKRRVAAARTHKKLASHTVSRCENCGEPRPPHRICPNCRTYKGRSYKPDES